MFPWDHPYIMSAKKWVGGWVGVVSLRKISRNFDFIEKLKRTFDTNAVTNAEKNRWVGFQKI